MSELIRTIFLKEAFSEFKRGNSKYTKTYCREHKGDFPVWSANNEVPLAYRDGYDYDGRYITVSINGIAGKITVLEGQFSTTADRVVGKPKDNVDIDYIKFVAEPILRGLAKGRRGEKDKNEFSKLTPDMIQNAKISIPVKEDGTFDLTRQKEIANNYAMVERYKNALKEKKKEIEQFVVAKIDGYEMVSKKLDEVFLNKRGDSKFTRAYMNSHKGKYPVYTGTTEIASDYVDTYEYDYPQLTYVTDGYAGTVEILDGLYTIGGHRAALTPIVDNIDILYCKYALAPAMNAAYKDGSVPSVVWTNLKDKTISIPVNQDGSFNIDAQREIAHKYSEIDRIKKGIVETLDKFLEYTVDFNLT